MNNGTRLGILQLFPSVHIIIGGYLKILASFTLSRNTINYLVSVFARFPRCLRFHCNASYMSMIAARTCSIAVFALCSLAL